MHFVNFMSEGSNRFGQHNAFSKRLTITVVSVQQTSLMLLVTRALTEIFVQKFLHRVQNIPYQRIFQA